MVQVASVEVSGGVEGDTTTTAGPAQNLTSHLQFRLKKRQKKLLKSVPWELLALSELTVILYFVHTYIHTIYVQKDRWINIAYDDISKFTTHEKFLLRFYREMLRSYENYASNF